MRRRRILRPLLLCCLIGFSLVALDRLVRDFLLGQGAINDLADIQTPAVLRAKIDAFKHFRGYKVVLFGDSIIFGSVLREHGDPHWREHNPANLLMQRIRADYPARDVLVMNLGMNGAVPGDMEVLTELLDGVRADLVIFDLTLRSFARDFARPEALLSREWLAECRGAANGAPITSTGDRLERALTNFLTEHWDFYRFRDLLQLRLFGNTPRAALEGLRRQTESALRHSLTTSPDTATLTQKAHDRYQTIRIDPDHAQVQALQRLLTQLSHRNQQTVIFYAKENPAVVGELLDAHRYQQLFGKLEDVIVRHSGTSIRFLRPIDELTPEHFLDHVHIDAQGYAILIEHLWREARQF